MSKNDTPEVKDKDDIVYLYKWNVDFKNKDDSTVIHPLSMDRFTVMNDYKNSNTPVISAKMRIKLVDILKLKEWQKSCTVKITCKRYDILKNKDGSYKECKSSIDGGFTTELVPIFNTGTFKAKYNKEEIEARDNNYTASDLNVDSASVSMILIDSRASNTLKKMICQVIAPGNVVGTAMQWMFSEAIDKLDGVIVDPPDNTGEQPAIIIPPLSFVQAMNHIQSVYGIYENGLQIYCDMDGILYVLDKFAEDHEHEAKVSNLTKLFIKDAAESSVGSVVRLKKNKTDDAQYVGVIPVLHNSNDVLDGEMYGNTVIFSSFQQGVDAVAYDKQKVNSSSAKDVAMAITRNKPTNDMTGTKTIADYDELNNMYNMASYFNSIEAMADRYTVSIKNCVMSDFKPNTIVELAFEDVTKNNEQAGKYFLNRTVFNFARIKTANQNKIIDDSEDLKESNYTPSITGCTCEFDISRRNPD